MGAIYHIPRRFMHPIPPVTPESIARAKAAADKEREEVAAMAEIRDDCKLDVSRALDLFGADVVRAWVSNWEAMYSPSTAGDPRR